MRTGWMMTAPERDDLSVLTEMTRRPPPSHASQARLSSRSTSRSRGSDARGTPTDSGLVGRGGVAAAAGRVFGLSAEAGSAKGSGTRPPGLPGAAFGLV